LAKLRKLAFEELNNENLLSGKQNSKHVSFSSNVSELTFEKGFNLSSQQEYSDESFNFDFLHEGSENLGMLKIKFENLTSR